jgi:hypothetical protein
MTLLLGLTSALNPGVTAQKQSHPRRKNDTMTLRQLEPLELNYPRVQDAYVERGFEGH